MPHVVLGSRGHCPECNDVVGLSDELIAFHGDAYKFLLLKCPSWELTKSGVDWRRRQEALPWKSRLKLTTEIYWQRKGRERLGVRISEAERKSHVKALRLRRA